MTKLQAETLAAVARGEVYQRNYGYSAWRISGATPSVVGRLVSMRLAVWGPITGDRIDCATTDAGRAALAQPTDGGET